MLSDSGELEAFIRGLRTVTAVLALARVYNLTHVGVAAVLRIDTLLRARTIEDKILGEETSSLSAAVIALGEAEVTQTQEHARSEIVELLSELLLTVHGPGDLLLVGVDTETDIPEDTAIARVEAGKILKGKLGTLSLLTEILLTGRLMDDTSELTEGGEVSVRLVLLLPSSIVLFVNLNSILAVVAGEVDEVSTVSGRIVALGEPDAEERICCVELLTAFLLEVTVLATLTEVVGSVLSRGELHLLLAEGEEASRPALLASTLSIINTVGNTSKMLSITIDGTDLVVSVNDTSHATSLRVEEQNTGVRTALTLGRAVGGDLCS